ncbi:Amino acid kinase family protein [Botrimarina colliarenosi]|uniref:Amino acid kinase family protein n=1 Tax=Botrimarina colliarenosi TaxID=2528001 RepID=A0A5C6A9K4_9BACT|nr:hypothetical protein [Botrimarina colliarenosi]TWT96090.1 Amino acid kinase family protein [Botrimarina colliarenosi]
MAERLVIKIGGSLLAEPGAMGRVAEWLAATTRPDQTRLLLAGGGAAVDGLRRIDAANPLSAEATHWGAIALMDANAALLADWIPSARLTERIPVSDGDWALRSGRWLREQEPSADGERLRIGWRTTSDAIAARIAACWDARLIFLKHTLREAYASLDEAAADGVVDPETPRLAAGLRSVTLLGAVSSGLLSPTPPRLRG